MPQLTVDDKSVLKSRVLESARRLDAWVCKNGWSGYDPYDIQGTKPYMVLLNVKRTLTGRMLRRLTLGPLLLGEAVFPTSFRSLFRVNPMVNAKGMALFGRGYLQLFETTGERQYRDRAIECLEWLKENRNSAFLEPCWGYPFNWHSGVIVPANTPASVVTAAACDAFWTAWRALGSRESLDICVGACEFFLNHLRIDEMADGTICFSYTPLDDFHVHNTNLLVAELLVRIGKETGRDDWVATGVRAAKYALSEQNADGSLFYWGRVQNHYNPNRIDHYHSGFEIRCLYKMWKLTGLEEFYAAMERYYRFYLRELIGTDRGRVAPMMYPRSLYPINIHSCAEALLMNATVAEEFSEARELLGPLFAWVVAKMQTPEGWFIYMRRRVLGIELTARIPYMRWGQAWMLLALSQCVKAMDSWRAC